jgi:hypothetical protein
MELREYQHRASETSQLRLGGPHGAVVPMLGLAATAGAILDTHQTYLRGGIDLADGLHLSEQLGDLLWYATAVATACGLDLAEIAASNLRRTRDLYAAATDRLDDLPVLDATFPGGERFPRRLVIEFNQRELAGGRLVVELRLIDAEPNAYPRGCRAGDGRRRGYQIGSALGAPLSDNSRRADGYRFHDAIHFGFLAVLGWSPNMRSLLGVKRKSDPMTDECEDGARAIFAEEGLAAVLSRLAPVRMGFRNEQAVTTEVIAIARAATTDLEVQVMPGWLWRRAIVQGFQAMAELADNSGGYLIVDLDARLLSYTTRRAGFGIADATALAA